MSELVFLVEEDVEGGYTARSLGEGIFTQGDTREQLLANIRDAVRCHFDSPETTPRIIRLHYVRDEVLTL
jgi:predicted RNase H-like HicB family nuclease